jgi:quercetin dioxygenase-like cupin family protein
MVVEGALTMNCDGQSQIYKPGEIFTMPRGRLHFESYGPEGAVVLLGRRT